jgi:hypothetical protein
MPETNGMYPSIIMFKWIWREVNEKSMFGDDSNQPNPKPAPMVSFNSSMLFLAVQTIFNSKSESL